MDSLTLCQYPSITWKESMVETNLTDNIFKLTAPYNNPYQETDKRLLFVCSAGLLRSATAANLFAKKGYNTRSCGSTSYALIPFSENLKQWADKIFFVNEENYLDVIRRGFDLETETIQVLNIPDNFEYNNPELITILEREVNV